MLKIVVIATIICYINNTVSSDVDLHLYDSRQLIPETVPSCLVCGKTKDEVQFSSCRMSKDYSLT